MQNYSNQDNMVLVQKQIQRSMEQKESQEWNPAFMVNQSMTKGKTTQLEKTIFNKCSWVNWTAICKRMKFLHCIKNKLKID